MKQGIYSKVGILLLGLGLLIVCYFSFSISKIDKNYEVKYTNEHYSLIENIEGTIGELTNKDTVDYFIENYSENELEYINVYYFKNDKEKIFLNKVLLLKVPSSKYRYINKKWYVENSNKRTISKENAVNEINTNIIKPILGTLIIHNSWENK